MIVFSFYWFFFRYKMRSILLNFEQACKNSCCCLIWSVFNENTGTHLCVITLVKYKSKKIVPTCTKMCLTDFPVTIVLTWPQIIRSTFSILLSHMFLLFDAKSVFTGSRVVWGHNSSHGAAQLSKICKACYVVQCLFSKNSYAFISAFWFEMT